MSEPSSPEDPLQRRFAAHARRIRVKKRFLTQQAMADAMDHMNQGFLSAVLGGKATVGLDFVMALGRASGDSLDYICFEDPEERWFHVGEDKRVLTEIELAEHSTGRPRQPIPPPAPRSAQPGGRKAGGK